MTNLLPWVTSPRHTAAKQVIVVSKINISEAYIRYSKEDESVYYDYDTVIAQENKRLDETGEPTTEQKQWIAFRLSHPETWDNWC